MRGSASALLPKPAVPVRPDEASGVVEGPAVAPGRGRLKGLLVTVGVLLLALLVAAGVVVHQRRSAAGRLDATRQQVVAAARQEAVNLMSLSYATADADLRRILSLATGPLAQQFASQRSTIGGFLGQAKSTSKGQVLSAGLVSLDAGGAEVLVAADATVSNNASTDAGMHNVVKHYRMSMKLQHVHGRWLVSDVGFDGAAQ